MVAMTSHVSAAPCFVYTASQNTNRFFEQFLNVSQVCFIQGIFFVDRRPLNCGERVQIMWISGCESVVEGLGKAIIRWLGEAFVLGHNCFKEKRATETQNSRRKQSEGNSVEVVGHKPCFSFPATKFGISTTDLFPPLNFPHLYSIMPRPFAQPPSVSPNTRKPHFWTHRVMSLQVLPQFDLIPLCPPQRDRVFLSPTWVGQGEVPPFAQAPPTHAPMGLLKAVKGSESQKGCLRRGGVCLFICR